MPHANRFYDYQLDKIHGKLFEETEVGGTEMVLRWNTEFDIYTLYFPAIDFKGHPMDADEEVIEISSDEEGAEKVFEFAKKLALEEKNVHDLYHKVGKFARSLDFETPKSNVQHARRKVSHYLARPDRMEDEAAA